MKLSATWSESGTTVVEINLHGNTLLCLLCPWSDLTFVVETRIWVTMHASPCSSLMATYMLGTHGFEPLNLKHEGIVSTVVSEMAKLLLSEGQ